jgi:hypothetical protein
VEIDLHFVRERVALGVVRVLHVPTTSQFADVFTKRLPSSVFAGGGGRVRLVIYYPRLFTAQLYLPYWHSPLGSSSSPIYVTLLYSDYH